MRLPHTTGPAEGQHAAAERTSVFVVADPRLLRDCLGEALDTRAAFEFVGSSSVTDAAGRIEQTNPRVVIVDLAHGDSLGLAAHVARSSATFVVGFGADDTEAQAAACADANIAGYVTKNATLDELADVLLAVTRTRPFLPLTPDTPNGRVSSLLAAARRMPAEIAKLTAREREVLVLLEEGRSNKEIAQRLNIEVATVKNHVHNLLGKLQVSSRGEAAAVTRSIGSRSEV